MAIEAVVGAQCLTLGACGGSGRNKGSAADTTIAFATIRNLQPVREEVQCRIYVRQHSPTASEGYTNLSYQLFDCHRQAAIVDRFLKE